MGKSIRTIAEEIGVSKQAVYKRFNKKLKAACAPYVYTQDNVIYITEEGEKIIKQDFIDNPSALPVYLQRQQNAAAAYGTQAASTPEMNNQFTPPAPTAVSDKSDIFPHTNTSTHTNTVPYTNTSAHTNTNTNQITPDTHTDTYPSSSSINTDTSMACTVFPDIKAPSDTSFANPEGHNTYVRTDINTDTHTYPNTNAHTNMDMQTYTDTNAYPSVRPNTHTDIDADTSAHMDTNTDTHTDLYAAENAALKEKMHQMELELVKARSETEKNNETIKFLNQRLSDKEQLINEQRQNIDKIDAERKILTASLLKNNSFIEELMKLPLSKRVFGWNTVKKQLTDSKNSVISDVTAGESEAGESLVSVEINDNDTDEK